MDNNHHLPPFPFPFPNLSAAAAPSGGHIPICHPLYGFSSIATPQSYFFTPPPPSHELLPAAVSQFPPSYVSYAFRPGNNDHHQQQQQLQGTNSLLLSKDNEGAGRRVLDAWSTKVARSKRRLARQRTLSLNRASSSSGFGNGTEEYSSKGSSVTTTFSNNSDISQNNNRTTTQNLFTFCTPDNKILRMLLKKELKNSDVGSLGRIVLPKREAEENLPLLTDKEGMQVMIRDVNSHRKWAMKYKYWANNRSRMYVLENTGDFVRQNGLVIGDSMTLYEDECKNLYVSIQKGDKHSSMEEKEMRNVHEEESAKTYTDHNMTIKDEEEEASLALLIEELKPPPNLIGSHNSDSGCSTASFERGCYITRRPYTAARGKGKEGELDQFHSMNNNGFEDCFGGLDTLPEVSGFNCSLFDYLSNDRT